MQVADVEICCESIDDAVRLPALLTVGRCRVSPRRVRCNGRERLQGEKG